jgi:cell division protein FtsB
VEQKTQSAWASWIRQADMDGYTELKRAAEACKDSLSLRYMESHGELYIRNDHGIVFDVHRNRSFPEIMETNKAYADLVLAARPSAVLSLIAEIEALKGPHDWLAEDLIKELVDNAQSFQENACEEGEDPFVVVLLSAASRIRRQEANIYQLKAELDCPFRLARHSKRLVEQLRAQAEQYDQALIKMAAERDQLRAEVAGLRTGYEAYERVNAELKAEVEGLREANDKLTRRNGMLEQNVEVMTEAYVLYTWLRKKCDQPSNDQVAVQMNIGHDWVPVHDLDRDLRTMIDREEP